MHLAVLAIPIILVGAFRQGSPERVVTGVYKHNF